MAKCLWLNQAVHIPLYVQLVPWYKLSSAFIDLGESLNLKCLNFDHSLIDEMF